MGSVTIHRRKSLWRDIFRRYDVIVDGNAVAAVKNGEAVTVALSPGQHKCRMKIDWCGSPEIELDGNVDSTLECGPGGMALTALIDITLRTDKYIDLKRI